MKYKVIWISVFLIGCISFGFFANHELMLYRYHQIGQEIQAYKEAEKTSYTEALGHYQKAKNELNSFLKRFPSSIESKWLKGNIPVLGERNHENLPKFEPILTEKSEAEISLLGCSWLVAKKIEPILYKTYDDNGLFIKDQMIIDTLGYDPSDEYSDSNLHEINPKLNPQDLVLSNIANDLANVGKYEEAKQTILKFDNEPERQFSRIGLLAYKAIKVNKKEIALNLLNFAMSLFKSSNFEILNIEDGLELMAEGYRLLGQNNLFLKQSNKLKLSIRVLMDIVYI